MAATGRACRALKGDMRGSFGLLCITAQMGVWFLAGCIFDPPGLTATDSQGLYREQRLYDQTLSGERPTDAVVRDGKKVPDLPPISDTRPWPDTGPTHDTLKWPDTQPAHDTLKWPDTKPWPDTQPWPDTKPWPDSAGPCGGITCPLGCNEALNPDRCYRIEPSNFSAVSFYSQVTANISPTQFNVSTGEVKDGATTLRQPGGKGTVVNGIFWDHQSQGTGYPELSIFGLESITVSASTTLVITGSSTENWAFALYAKGAVTIAGKVQAVSSTSTAGPGGFDGGAAGSSNGVSGAACPGGGEGGGGQSNGVYDSGGGGGGRGTDGGAGGTTQSTLQGGAGGKAAGAFELIPLFGGCGGGGGSGSQSYAGDGGGGGGAIQIASDTSITISSTGIITVPGAGGRGSSADYYSGGGGGSGGAILLEAPEVTVDGILAANGGGGGGGGNGNHAGDDGQASLSEAPGGAAGSNGTVGGSGGALNSSSSMNGANGSYNTGGGGGAAGRIRINSPDIIITSTNSSPTPSTSITVSKW